MEPTGDERWSLSRPFRRLLGVRRTFFPASFHLSGSTKIAECDRFQVCSLRLDAAAGKGDVLGSLTTCLSFQNEWTEAVDTDGRGGAAGADGDGGRGRQRTEARWDRSNLSKTNISAFLND